MSGSERPYLSWSTDQIAVHIGTLKDQPKEVSRVLEELSYRRTQVARNLERKLLALQAQHNEGRKTLGRMSPETRNFMVGSLEKLRDKLIDISKRNPLIAFKHSERGATFVRVVDELPNVLFDRLQSGSMRFEPLPNPEEEPADQRTARYKIALETARLTDEAYLKALASLGEGAKDEETIGRLEAELNDRVRASLGLPKLTGGKRVDIEALARANGFNPSFELPQNDQSGAHLSDNTIRVLYTRDRLEARLRTIYDRYRGHAAELGIHTLQVIFGFVQWKEADGEKTTHVAPLLLMQVHLRREIKAGRYVYALEGQDEVPVVNMALQELLRRNYGVVLPAYEDDETPEDYFLRVQAIFEEAKKELRVSRFVTIAVVPFPNMAVWSDLSAAQWPDEQILAHPQIQQLLGATGGSSGGSAFPADYDVETMAPATVPPLVLPADVSQHSAMVDVCGGKSLAIEGPPGTGKSQTIANMIAACLERGQRVLFVAEKRAALEVVARRLEALGFGPLMLELHSERSTKSEVIESLRQRLKAQPGRPSSVLDQTRKDLGQRRELLKLYRSLLRQTAGSLGRPVNALIWREMSLRQKLGSTVPRELWTESVDDGSAIDALDLSRRREALDAVEGSAKAIGDAFESFDSSRWHAVGNAPAQPIGQDAVRQQLDRLSGDLDALLSVSKTFASQVNGNGPNTLSDLRAWVDASSELPDPDDLEDRLLAAALDDAAIMSGLADEITAWRELHDQVLALHQTPATAPIDKIVAAEAAFRIIGATGSSLATAQHGLAEAKDRRGRLNGLNLFATQHFSKIAAGAAATASNLGAVAEALVTMNALDDACLAIKSASALEESAKSRLTEAARIAEQLRTQEEKVALFCEIGRLAAMEAHDIESLATVMTSTSFVLRPFSGNYRAALSRARMLTAKPAAKGETLAQGLLDAAGYIRAKDAFHGEKRYASLFPDAAWAGHHSDFSNAERLFDTVGKLGNQLARIGLAHVLDALVAEPSRSLRYAAEQAGVLESGFQAFRDLDSAADLDTAMGELDERIRLQALAIAAGEAAGLGADVAIGPAEQLSGRLSTFQDLTANLETAKREQRWFSGVQEDPDTLRFHAEWAEAIADWEMPDALRGAMAGSAAPCAVIHAIKETTVVSLGALERFDGDWTEFHGTYDVDGDAFLGRSPDDIGLSQFNQAVREARADEVGLRLYADFGRYTRAAETLGLADFVDEAQRLDSLDQLADTFELALIRTLLQALFQADGGMFERLGGAQLADASNRFVDLDRTLAELEAARIIGDRLGDDVPIGNGSYSRSTWTDLCLIENECSKIKRHIPIRDLVGRAHDALQALKPVWLMSPTSVAQFVAPGKAEFDLILIDEASQMTPEMAIGALARGRQIVVVGDPKQLPPSNFFKNRADTVDNDDEDDEGLDIDTESVLDLAFARLNHRRRLKWHYRSQHAKLIQFSNRQFYDSELVVFPSPITSDDFLGVRSEFVAGTYEGRVNVKEAEAIIEALVGLIYARPELTFGVVTMNTPQRDLLAQEFDRIRSQDKVVAAYAQAREGTVDELFIKNLENVQGDERDIILISTLYGPPPGGGRVMQRFGLFNRKDGHRRLNVLVTRSRMATLLYSSMRPTDVVITETSSHGVRSFKEYLSYAEGAPTVDDGFGGLADSDFEEFVAERISAHGYEVVPQVGVEGFRIDLGVKHPAFPSGFLAGVECDGASYHSGLSVRDRDRIRQEVLERLGWRIYRVWSTDWFNDPERETTKLIAWLERLREKAEATIAGKPSKAPASAKDTAEASQASSEQAGTRKAAPEPAPSVDTVVTSPSGPSAASLTQAPVQVAAPSGKRHTVDGIDFYEDMPGFFEVWLDGAAQGSVERLNTAVRAAHVYGSSFKVEKPQFRVTRYWDETMFISDDIYAGVRRLAANYREQLAPTEA